MTQMPEHAHPEQARQAEQAPQQVIAAFTLTVCPDEVKLRDHADQSVHQFKNLLGAMGYIELISRTREHAARDGGLL